MRQRWLRVVMVVTVASVLAACSSNDTSTTSETTAPASDGGSDAGGPTSGVATVTIAGFAFNPSDVTLPEGDTLTVRNEDTATHTFTMDDGSIDETLEPGDQVEVTPGAEGGFHCSIHPSMTGSISFG